MAFLHRSKSQVAKDHKSPAKKDESKVDRTDAPAFRVEAKKSMAQERPQTADRRKSFSRPRTATSANKAAERSADLPIAGQTIEIKQGNDTFNFPTPSPRLPPPRSTTLRSSASPLNGDSPRIGVAIGSPTQMPPQWGRSFTVDHLSKRMPAQPPPARAPPTIPERAWTVEQAEPRVEPELRRKKSGWKSFGGLFGRKKPADKEPFYKVQLHPDLDKPAARIRAAADTPSPAPSPAPALSPSSVAQHHKRSPSLTRGIARFEARAEADRASFMPSSGQPRITRTPSAIQKESLSPGFQHKNSYRASEDMFKAIDEERNDSPLSTSEKSGLIETPRTPRLDLEIPKPEMERYSVMFEKLFAERRPSLLQRRQSKMKKKKSFEVLEAIGMPEDAERIANDMPQRSVTSPHLKTSLSVKVGKKVRSPGNATTSDEPVTALHRPRPIQRSRTAPPGSVSPVAPNFSKRKVAVVREGSSKSPSSMVFSENSLPPTPTTLATVSDMDSVAIINHLPKQNRYDDEPTWDMATSKARDESPDPYLRVRSPEDIEKQIVQVSVARQVSVTKARKQVRQAAASKQPLRPRVVELSKDRKSTVVVIEGGDD